MTTEGPRAAVDAGRSCDIMVSVIVLTWEREALLRETVESVLGQTYRDLELLVIDNESTDGTETYVRGIADDRVRYFRHANGGNISVNRNFGIHEARGCWIAFCDDDDLWEPEKLEAQMSVVIEDPGVSMVCTNALAFSGDEEYGPMIRGRSTGEMRFEELLVGWHDVLISSVLLKQGALEATGSFNEDSRVFSVEDYEYWLRFGKDKRIHYLDETLVRYRIHTGMASHRDTRQVLAKQKVVFKELHQHGMLTDREYATASEHLTRNLRVARFKQAVKTIPGATRAVYAAKRWIHRLRSGSEAGS